MYIRVWVEEMPLHLLLDKCFGKPSVCQTMNITFFHYKEIRRSIQLVSAPLILCSPPQNTVGNNSSIDGLGTQLKVLLEPKYSWRVMRIIDNTALEEAGELEPERGKIGLLPIFL